MDSESRTRKVELKCKTIPTHMASKPITPALKAQIISSIKKGSTSAAKAAATYKLTERTIREWLRGPAKKVTNPSDGLHLQRENQQLRAMLGKLLLERELGQREQRA